MDGIRAIVVMGVCGCGKSSVAEGLASALSGLFIEGDAYHPAVNVTKMSMGVPLTDEDRVPWLDAIGRSMAGEIRKGKRVVASCSALKKEYRDRLRVAVEVGIAFVYLDGRRDVLTSRLEARKDHFMPTTLLDSQLATLEKPSGEPGVVTIDIDQPLKSIVSAALGGLAKLEHQESLRYMAGAELGSDQPMKRLAGTPLTPGLNAKTDPSCG